MTDPEEKHHGDEAGVAATDADSGMRHTIERAVQLCLRKERRDAGQ